MLIYAPKKYEGVGIDQVIVFYYPAGAILQVSALLRVALSFSS